MAYTTVERIRAESWFTWNSDISDNYIEWYLNQSHWIIIWRIGIRYDISKLSWSLFTWSQAEEMLKRIEELISSSYLLIAEYWNEARGSDKDWYNKIKQANALLDQITAWTLKLFDINWNEFWTKSISTSSSWLVLTLPNPEPPRYFKVDDIY